MLSLTLRTTRLLAVALLAAVGSAHAQSATPAFSKPEDAVAYRKSVFVVMEKHFGRLNSMAVGRIPFEKTTAVLDANTVQLLATLPFHAFIPGSENVGNTRANEQLWKAMPRFQADGATFYQKTQALPAAAAAGDLEALKTLLKDAGATCRKCHEQFRTR